MQITKPSVEELENKLQVQLGQYEWFQTYRYFDFRPVIEGLEDIFFPRFSQILNPLTIIKPHEVTKIVIEQFGVPPFSTEPGYLPYDSCRETIEETTGIELRRHLWRGVLILPLNLTNAPKRQSYHQELWKTFIAYTIDHFNQRENMIWILSGHSSWEWEDYINPEHLVTKHYSPVIQKTPSNGHLFKLLQSTL